MLNVELLNINKHHKPKIEITGKVHILKDAQISKRNVYDI